MKEKDHLGKKVHESKFYETFLCTFSTSFPMVPLTPPLVASDPTTECVLFCIRFFVNRQAKNHKNCEIKRC